MHILPNNSRRKSNQTIRLGQLIEYNLRKFLLKSSFTKCVKETMADLFLKIQNWAYISTNSLKFYTVSFYCMPSWALSKDIETKHQTTGFYLIWRFFEITKMGLKIVPNSTVCFFLISGKMCVVIVFLTSFMSQILKLTLSF